MAPTPGEHETAAAVADRAARRGELRLALLVGLGLSIPLALVGAPIGELLLVWAGLVAVYGLLLRAFGLRSVIESGLFVCLLAINVAIVVWVFQNRRAPQVSPVERAKTDGGSSRASTKDWPRPAK